MEQGKALKTVPQIKALQPADKPYSKCIEGGLRVKVFPNGKKYFSYRFMMAGKSQEMPIGTFPLITLTMANDLISDAKRLIRDGINPIIHKKLAVTPKTVEENTFKACAEEWNLSTQVPLVKNGDQTEDNRHRKMRMLIAHIYPHLGKEDINSITSGDLLKALQKLEALGKFNTAHRTLGYCIDVWQRSVVRENSMKRKLANHNVARDLLGQLKPIPKPKHFAKILDPALLGQLLRSIEVYGGHPLTRLALKLAPHVFVRPGNLRRAEWAHINLEKKIWRIPAGEMKKRRTHLVPLSPQVCEILEEAKLYSGDEKYVFPGLLSKKRPMCENTINQALRRMDYSSDVMTGHGFRGIAFTLLREAGFEKDHIKTQMSHLIGSAVDQAYDESAFLSQRTKMMHFWSNYLDQVKNGATILPFQPLAA